MINNILKKIEKANEVQKVELEKHEVELASIAELKKLTDAAQKDLENHNKYAKELKSMAKLVTEYGDNFRAKTQQISDLGLTLKKQFADLGLNYFDNADVQRAVALLKKDFDIRSFTDQARQIK